MNGDFSLVTFLASTVTTALGAVVSHVLALRRFRYETAAGIAAELRRAIEDGHASIADANNRLALHDTGPAIDRAAQRVVDALRGRARTRFEYAWRAYQQYRKQRTQVGPATLLATEDVDTTIAHRKRSRELLDALAAAAPR